MRTLLKVSEQTFWQVGSKVITTASTLIVLSLIAKNYGTEGVGSYTLAITYLAFFYLLVDLGLNAYLLPKVLSDRMIFRKLLGFRIIWAAALGLVAIITLSLMPFNNPILSELVKFGAITIFLNAAYQSFTLIFQAKLRYQYSSLVIATLALTILGGSWILVNLGKPLGTLFIPQVAAWILAGGLAVYLVGRVGFPFRPLFQPSFIFITLTRAWPVTLTLIINTLYFRVDAFLLASFRSLTEVGVYNLAYSLFQTALVLPTFIMNSYYPLMVKGLKVNPAMFEGNLVKAGVILTSLSVFGVVLTWLLSPTAILLITGGYLEGSVSSLRILALSFPAFFLSALLMWALISLQRYKLVLLIYLVGLLVNVTLNYLLIPHFSYLAASYITGISEYLILTMELISLWRIRNK